VPVFGQPVARATTKAALFVFSVIPSVLHAQAAASKVSVHGYLTQGWGRSSGVAFYGLSDDASTDFRYAALQLRYIPTSNDQFVVQVPRATTSSSCR
jgi:hypothetical protein